MKHVTVLGSVKSRSEESQWETLAPNARQLLAIMVAAGPAGLSFERVADELWPKDLPPTWDPSLRMALTRLRRRLPPGSLTSKGRWCRLELPVDHVDVWHLAELANSPQASLSADQLIEHIAQEAYPNVEISPIIRAAIGEFDLRRVLLLERLNEQHAAISPLTAARLGTFAESRDWDAPLAEQAKQLAANATQGMQAASARSIATPLPSSLARQRPNSLFGRDAAVEELVALAIDERQPLAMLAAEPRSGRSATLAEVGALLADKGWRVVHLEPRLPAAAFGPFLQALPHLREPLLAALESNASAAQIRSRCWTSILQALDHPDLPTCLIVDDVELLDSNSEEALAFIGRARTSNPLSILIAADPAHPAVAASDWMDAPAVQLDALEPDDQWAMISEVHPHSVGIQRLQLSDQISELAGGLAGHAYQLVKAADSDTLTLPPLLTPNNGADSDRDPAAIGLPPEVLAIAAAASIIRSPISLDRLEHVTRSEPHLVLTAVDELLGVGVLTETSRPDVFELAPAHRHSDFGTALPPHELAGLHRRAMALPDRGPVALAADALRARPLVSDADAITALLAAAASLVASHSHREAVAHFRAAEDLGAQLQADQLIDYATSLEFLGVDAVKVRERAMALALKNGEAGVALKAALAGLPEAEQIDGDEARARLIASVDPTKLTRTEQLERRLALSRQLLLLARSEDATKEALAAGDLVETVDEEADVWLALAHIGGWLPTGDCDVGFRGLRFRAPDDVIDLRRRSRLHQAAAVSSMIAGDFVSAAAEIDRLTLAAEASADPLRIWNASLLQTTKLTNELRFDEAERTADEAQAVGVSFGLSVAVAGRLAQRACRSALTGEVDDTAEHFEIATPDTTSSMLAQAGTSLLLTRTGRLAEATEVVERVLGASSGSTFELAVAGLVSGAIGRTSPLIGRRISEVLEPHRGQILVIGGGLSCHGPIEGLLANVAADDAAALELRHAAVELADGWQSPLWQILTRIELAGEYGRVDRAAEQRTFMSEAAERAAGTEFATHECWGLFES